jgi:RTX calcium-binding nonapeptide repeat (4 copies)
MAYTLTSQEYAEFYELNQLITGQLDPTNAQYWQGQPADFVNNYYLAYAFLRDAQTESGGVSTPKPDVDASAWLWFRGATQINQGIGASSTFIGEYTKEQYRLRTGGTATDDLIQQASNDIATAVIADVLSHNGTIPTITELGQRDAGGVVGLLYGDVSDFASWSGAPLFLFFGVADFFNAHIIDQKNGTYDLLALIESGLKAAGATVGSSSLLDLTNGFLTALQALTANTQGASVTSDLLVQAFNDAQTFFASNYATYNSGVDRFFESELILGKLNEGDELDTTPGADIVHAGGGNDLVRGSIDNDILDGGDGTDTLDYTELGAATQTSFQVSQNGALTGITTKGVNLGRDLWTNFESLKLGNLRDDVRMPDLQSLTPDALEQLKNLKIDGGGGEDYIERLNLGGQVDGGADTDTVSYAKLDQGLTIYFENLTPESIQSDGLEIDFPVQVASNGGAPDIPADHLKSVEKLLLTDKADTVRVDASGTAALKVLQEIDAGGQDDGTRDVLDLTQFGTKVEFLDGKIKGYETEFKNFEKLVLSPFDDKVELNGPNTAQLQWLETGAGKDVVDSNVINLTIYMGTGENTLKHAGQGSIVYLEGGHNTVRVSDDVLVVDAKPTDVIQSVTGWTLHGAIGRIGQESPWITGWDGTKYGLNPDGQLAIRDAGSGTTLFIANYQGGPNVPFGLQTAGIFVGLASVHAERLIDVTTPLTDNVTNTFKLGNAIMFTLTGQTFFNVRYDPLVLDLNGDGVHLTPLSGAAPMFDMQHTGFGIPTGWVQGDDALLVRDRNGNGQIDDVSELFGNAEQPGFAALAAYDSNSDGVVDANDQNFAQLRVWQDANGNARIHRAAASCQI